MSEHQNENQIVRYQGGDIVPDMPLPELAKALIKSGYFIGVNDPSQAIVKVLAGREIGLGPIQSMQGFYIVKGRVSQAAQQMGLLIKRSGKYDYRVTKQTKDECTIEFLQLIDGKWQKVGESPFTMQDAITAGLTSSDMYKKWPRNMLMWRALANGARMFCPDALGGAIYTPEELGADTDEQGVPNTQTAPTVTITEEKRELPPLEQQPLEFTREQWKAINARVKSLGIFDSKEQYLALVKARWHVDVADIHTRCTYVEYMAWLDELARPPAEQAAEVVQGEVIENPPASGMTQEEADSLFGGE